MNRRRFLGVLAACVFGTGLLAASAEAAPYYGGPRVYQRNGYYRGGRSYDYDRRRRWEYERRRREHERRRRMEMERRRRRMEWARRNHYGSRRSGYYGRRYY